VVLDHRALYKRGNFTGRTVKAKQDIDCRGRYVKLMLSEKNPGQFAVNTSMMHAQSKTPYTRYQDTHSKDAAAYSLGAQLHFRFR